MPDTRIAAPTGPESTHEQSNSLPAQAEPGMSTVAVQAGVLRDLNRAITTPVSGTASYRFPDTAAVIAHVSGEQPADEYGRYGSPNERQAEAKLAALEGAESAILFNNGMKALTSLFWSKLEAGDEIVFFDECYHRSRTFASTYLSKFGVKATEVRTGDYDALEAAITDHTKLLVSESPTNPHLSIIDVERFADIGKRRGVETVIDATLATPYNIRPLDAGVDYVMHSVTKYLGGHNNVLAGVVAGSREKLEDILSWRNFDGGNATPQTAATVDAGLQTFELRMQRHNENGQLIAEFLAQDPRVSRVYYPGLPQHPQHEVAKSQMRGFGGMVSFEVANADMMATSRVVDALKIPQIAASLGATQTLVQQPRILNHWKKTREELERIRIPDNMIRYSCGIENAKDLIADLDQALDAAGDNRIN